MMSRPILKGYFPQMQIDPNSSLSIIIIDDSYSLNGIKNNYNRIQIINKKYKEILGSFNDNTQICILSLSKGILYDGLNLNLPDLSKLLSITNSRGELYSYVNMINQKFDNSIINKEVFIITDGQANLFENISKEEIYDWKIYFALLDNLESNLKINYAKILNSSVVKDETIDIEVEIENNGLTNINNKMVNIFVNEMNVGLHNVSVDAGNKKTILFSTVLTNYKNNSIRLSLSEDDNDSDNDYYINSYIPEAVRVLSVFNNPDNMKYISTVIDAVNKNNKIFSHSNISYLNLTINDLILHDVVIVYDYKIIEYHYNLFDEYLANNKHLIVLPEKNNNLNELYGLIAKADKNPDYIYLDNQNYEKIIYNNLVGYKNKEVNGNEQKYIKVFKYIQNAINPNSFISIGELNSFWDKIYFENSQIDIFYSLFHLDWNDFPLKGGFIQFINELLYSGFNSSNYNKFIQDELSFNINTKNPIKEIIHKFPNGISLFTTPISDVVYTQDLSVPGLHNFYDKDKLIYSAAVNIHPKEIMSKILTPKEIEKELEVSCYFLKSEEGVLASIVNTREGYELWRYLLWLLCFIIIIEMLISNGNRET